MVIVLTSCKEYKPVWCEVLKKFLKKNITDKGLQDKLLVCDKPLGQQIKEKLEIGPARVHRFSMDLQ